VLSDGFFTLRSRLLAMNLAEAELKEFVKANHFGTNTVFAQINVVLVNTGDRRVLIDAGGGSSPPRRSVPRFCVLSASSICSTRNRSELLSGPS
jgi:hypothetical protein